MTVPRETPAQKGGAFDDFRHHVNSQQYQDSPGVLRRDSFQPEHHEREEGNNEEVDDEEPKFAAEDPLFDILVQVRKQLIKGDCRAI